MEKETSQEILSIILTAIVFAASMAIFDRSIFISALLSFLIIISSNIAVKKLMSYNFEIKIRTTIWALSRYGMRKKDHFKKPISTILFPIIFSIISKGYFLWLGVLEFTAEPRPERASKRHGIYRFTQVTERHLGVIALFGVLTNIILGLIGYIAGFELFAKLSIYFAMWSVIPISRLDGSKILFANRALWILVFIITSILTILSLALI